jgi:hypothetical protein
MRCFVRSAIFLYKMPFCMKSGILYKVQLFFVQRALSHSVQKKFFFVQNAFFCTKGVFFVQKAFCTECFCTACFLYRMPSILYKICTECFFCTKIYFLYRNFVYNVILHRMSKVVYSFFVTLFTVKCYKKNGRIGTTFSI